MKSRVVLQITAFVIVEAKIYDSEQGVLVNIFNMTVVNSKIMKIESCKRTEKVGK